MSFSSWLWLPALPLALAACAGVAVLVEQAGLSGAGGARRRIRTAASVVPVVGETLSMALLAWAVVDGVLSWNVIPWRLQSFLLFGLQGVGLTSTMVVHRLRNSCQRQQDAVRLLQSAVGHDPKRRPLLDDSSSDGLQPAPSWTCLRSWMRQFVGVVAFLPIVFDAVVVVVLAVAPRLVRIYLPIVAACFAALRALFAVHIAYRAVATKRALSGAMSESLGTHAPLFLRLNTLLLVSSVCTIAYVAALPGVIVALAALLLSPANALAFIVSYWFLGVAALAGNSLAIIALLRTTTTIANQTSDDDDVDVATSK